MSISGDGNKLAATQNLGNVKKETEEKKTVLTKNIVNSIASPESVENPNIKSLKNML